MVRDEPEEDQPVATNVPFQSVPFQNVDNTPEEDNTSQDASEVTSESAKANDDTVVPEASPADVSFLSPLSFTLLTYVT